MVYIYVSSNAISYSVLGYFYIVTLLVVACSLGLAILVVYCARKRNVPSMMEKVNANISYVCTLY